MRSSIMLVFSTIMMCYSIFLMFHHCRNEPTKVVDISNKIEEVATPNKQAVYTITLTKYHTYITEINTNKTYRVRHEDINDLFLWLNL